MRKKYSLTLLEIVVAITLLGFLLTGLFNCFRQGIKKNIAAKELKQKVLELELFQQRLKNLFDEETGLSLQEHPEASGLALIVNYNQPVDPEFEMCGILEGMLFLNKNKELCLASWSEKGKGRIEILLDKVDAFKCGFFDSKKREWIDTWSSKEEKKPVMVSIDLVWNGNKVPFVFFLVDSSEQISYPGT
jgi:type II secretory pathway component PulJ